VHMLLERAEKWPQKWRQEGLDEGLRKGRDEGLRKGRDEGLRKGRDEGLRKGRDEGQKQGLRLGKAELLKNLASHRFGELSPEDARRFDRADVDTLDRWSRLLLEAMKLEDVFEDRPG